MVRSSMNSRRPHGCSNQSPFLFNNFQIPPSPTSIYISRIFCGLQIPLCASPVFSQPSALPGCHPSRTDFRLGFRVSIFAFRLSGFAQRPCFQPFAHSLYKSGSSLSLFSTACGLFWQIPGACPPVRRKKVSQSQIAPHSSRPLDSPRQQRRLQSGEGS